MHGHGEKPSPENRLNSTNLASIYDMDPEIDLDSAEAPTERFCSLHTLGGIAGGRSVSSFFSSSPSSMSRSGGTRLGSSRSARSSFSSQFLLSSFDELMPFISRLRAASDAIGVR